MRREGKAAWTLVLLSPVFGELVSSSMPPLEFFNPLAFLGVLGLYGCGALLIREAGVRWGKGWASILLLGAAYGILEEGVVVQSWFNPGWMDLGILSWYGRFAGVNWVWAVWLTIYHMTVSIALPIFLIGVLFPDLKGKRLLAPGQLKWPLVALSLTCVFMFVFFLTVGGYQWGPEYGISVVLALVFTAAARQVPSNLLRPMATVRLRRAYPLAILGFVWILTAFVAAGPAADAGAHPLVPAFIGILGTLMVWPLVFGLSTPETLERNLMAFFMGAEAVFIMIGGLLGLVAPAAYFGETAVSASVALWLIVLYRRIKARAGPTPNVVGPPPGGPLQSA